MAVNGDAFAVSGGPFASRGAGLNWMEFCEHHASSAAEEFSQQVTQFLQDNAITLSGIARRDFVIKYVECFQRHFDAVQVCLITACRSFMFCNWILI
jgi:hypothetical protein